MIRVGMDFGTSNSSLGLYENERVRLFRVDEGNINPRLLRSFLYLDRAYDQYTGAAAVRKYLENETGRPVYWELKPVGTIENVWAGVPSTDGAPIFEIRDVVAEVDTAERGRLLQSIKTVLRNPVSFIRGRSNSPRIQIFDRLYPVEDLIAMLMQAMKQQAEAVLGKPIKGVVVGRPVTFSEDENVDTQAEGILRQAAEFAGFEDISFELEPIAAAYMYHQRTGSRQTALVFDFGGGTLDLTIMKLGGPEAPEVLATHGVLVGGDDLDRRLMSLMLPYFGEGAQFEDGRPFPAHLLEMLESWQTMVNLSRPKYRDVLRDAARGSNPEAVARLETLVRNNLGFQLFQELEQAKIRLSALEETEIIIPLKDTEILVPVSRVQFERLIRSELAEVSRSLDEILEKSGLQAGDIQVVLRTGGSAQIPAFIRLLAGKFGEQSLRPLNPFETIVGGLALRASGLTASPGKNGAGRF